MNLDSTRDVFPHGRCVQFPPSRPRGHFRRLHGAAFGHGFQRFSCGSLGNNIGWELVKFSTQMTQMDGFKNQVCRVNWYRVFHYLYCFSSRSIPNFHLQVLHCLFLATFILIRCFRTWLAQMQKKCTLPRPVCKVSEMESSPANLKRNDSKWFRIPKNGCTLTWASHISQKTFTWH